MKKPLKKTLVLDRIGYLCGLVFALIAYSLATMSPANAIDGTNTSTIPLFASVTTAMLLATFLGSVGSYLAFGEDKKFPPSATSVGHVLLGFGAGLFFTRGSLELMGKLHSSEDVVLFVSFLWAAVGYFALRLGVAVINSERIKDILPDWLAKLLGVSK